MDDEKAPKCKRESCTRVSAEGKDGFCFACHINLIQHAERSRPAPVSELKKELDSYERDAFKARNYSQFWSDLSKMRKGKYESDWDD